jgi:chromosome segregation ATPase
LIENAWRSIRHIPQKYNSKIVKAIRKKITNLENKIKSQEKTIEGYKNLEEKIKENHEERDAKLARFNEFWKARKENDLQFKEFSDDKKRRCDEVIEKARNKEISIEETRKIIGEIHKEKFDMSDFEEKWAEFWNTGED